MNPSAQALFAIWTGVFLVLPGCLCQVLGAFGWPEDRTESASAPGSAFVALQGANLSICHCDDDLLKVGAEIVEASVRAPDQGQGPLFANALAAEWIIPASPGSPASPSRAPPDERIPSLTSLERSGAYLL